MKVIIINKTTGAGIKYVKDKEEKGQKSVPLSSYIAKEKTIS